MNVLAVETRKLTETPGVGVRLIVDGHDFVDRVCEYEAAFAGTLAGRYDLLPVEEALPPSRHLLGAPGPRYSGEDDSPYLLICGCGEPGCWPLEARVTVSPDTVTWSHFRQPHRPHWSYEGFGPFVFDRAQYEAALRALAGRLSAAPPEHCER